MKIPLSQLKEHLSADLSLEESSDRLTSLGLEVDAVEGRTLSFSGVVTGKIEKREPHPNADRLCIATVNDGSRLWQVVCGAPNCQEGMITAFARSGAHLTDTEGKEWKIKESKLRGVISQGMLCSAKELGFGEEEEGIISFPLETSLGTPLETLFLDPIFEISLTPNLSHCFCIRGVARELAASLHTSLKPLSFILKEEGRDISDLIEVKVHTENCSRYTCRVIENVTIAPSPEWLRKAVEKCGSRSVNNVVDVTNYVMYHLGIPLHSFDYDKIKGKKIQVTSSEKTFSFLSLDGIEREVSEGAVLINDSEEVIAIAGIIGGEGTKVSSETKNIVLEAACFSPLATRKTRKKLDLRTEAALRFEKGCDPNGVIESLNWASFLLNVVAGGVVSRGLIDVYPKPLFPREISCNLKRINALIGVNFSLNEAQELLERLGIKTEIKQEAFLAIPPTYRFDLKEEVDIAEEIARLYGYKHISKENPHYFASTIPSDPLFVFEKKVRKTLLREGLQEFITCDLISPFSAHLTVERGLEKEHLISVLNPRSLYNSVLRASLLTGLLEVAKLNESHQIRDLLGFEIGKIHFKEGEVYQEEYMVAIMMKGARDPLHYSQKQTEVDFFDLKGALENLCEALNLPLPHFTSSSFDNFHPHIQASISLNGIKVGACGQVHPEECKLFEISTPLFFAELSLVDLMKSLKLDQKMKKLPLYPGSFRDWTVTISDSVPLQTVFENLNQLKSPFLEKIKLIDLYKSDKIGKDKRNITIRFFYRDLNQTIALETVEKEYQKLLQEMEKFL